MKKIIITIALFSVTLVIASCTKDISLLPQSSATVGTFFKTAKDINSSLAGMYGSFLQQMTGTGGTNGGNGNYFYWGESRSDNMNSTGFSVNASITEDVANSIASDNAASDWAGLYQTIGRANVNIANIPNVSQFDNTVTPTITNNALAQCYAMRAECYFYIVRNWGAAPVWTTPYLDPTQPGTKPRVAVKTIIDSVIIPDLTKAYSLIQPGQPSVVWNINEAGICAIMADVYMWRAGAPVALTPGGPVGGPIGGQADYQNAILWTQKLFAAHTPIASVATYGGTNTSLESTATWKNVFLNPAGSPEGIWSLAWDQSVDGCACIPVSIQNSNNPLGMDAGLYASWPKNTADIRVKQTIDPTLTGSSAGEMTLKYYNAATQAALTAQSSPLLYNVYLVMYRLSDVYLTYAEALNQTNDLPNALKYLNYIHTRAGLPAILATAVPTTATMQAAILQERQWELFAEGKRWYDLVRTNTVAATMTPILIGRKTTGFTDMNRVLWPLSVSALNANSLLIQNASYY
jgi:hypothetical protein